MEAIIGDFSAMAAKILCNSINDVYELFGNEIIDRKDLEMKEKILVFIPMYNCEKQIVRVLDQLNGEIKKYISEAIIVNNRSTDNGEQAAIEKIKKMNAGFPIKVLKNRENYGLGGTHKVAFITRLRIILIISLCFMEMIRGVSVTLFRCFKVANIKNMIVV